MGSLFETISVHPHVCGEHVTSLSQRRSGSGSSPRMWGTPNPMGGVVSSTRFIPTYVGNTPATLFADFRNAVHPHVCGEHMTFQPNHHVKNGSSPRMWGTPLRIVLDIRKYRFIPTYVGNTGLICIGLSATPVHPHVCGEHSETSGFTFDGHGSSPRMWGTLTGSGVY